MKVTSSEDFMNKIAGEGTLSKSIDATPARIQAVSGAFVIEFKQRLMESTANRLKKVIIKHKSLNDSGNDVYFNLLDGQGKNHLLKLGNVVLTMSFYKDITNIFQPFKTSVEYKKYENGVFELFDSDCLINTVKFKKASKKEEFI